MNVGTCIFEICGKKVIVRGYPELENCTGVLDVEGMVFFFGKKGELYIANTTTGKIRKTPYYINLLLVSVPTQKNMTDGVEELSNEDMCARIIADICEAAIKCGARDLILDPYAYKMFRKEPHITAELWYQITTGQRFIEQFESVVFTVENEELFVIFNAVNAVRGK